LQHAFPAHTALYDVMEDTAAEDCKHVIGLFERYTRRCNAGVIKPTQAGAGGGGANCGCEDGPHYFKLGRFAQEVGSPNAAKGLL
jgi:hypothetical protein